MESCCHDFRFGIAYFRPIVEKNAYLRFGMAYFRPIVEQRHISVANAYKNFMNTYDHDIYMSYIITT